MTFELFFRNIVILSLRKNKFNKIWVIIIVTYLNQKKEIIIQKAKRV